MNRKNAQKIGAINDLSIAAEFLMAALREIAAGAAPQDQKVREWVGRAARQIAPLAKT